MMKRLIREVILIVAGVVFCYNLSLVQAQVKQVNDKIRYIWIGDSILYDDYSRYLGYSDGLFSYSVYPGFILYNVDTSLHIVDSATGWQGQYWHRLEDTIFGSLSTYSEEYSKLLNYVVGRNVFTQDTFMRPTKDNASINWQGHVGIVDSVLIRSTGSNLYEGLYIHSGEYAFQNEKGSNNYHNYMTTQNVLYQYANDTIFKVNPHTFKIEDSSKFVKVKFEPAICMVNDSIMVSFLTDNRVSVDKKHRYVHSPAIRIANLNTGIVKTKTLAELPLASSAGMTYSLPKFGTVVGSDNDTMYVLYIGYYNFMQAYALYITPITTQAKLGMTQMIPLADIGASKFANTYYPVTGAQYVNGSIYILMHNIMIQYKLHGGFSGIEEVSDLAESILVYPNPAKDIVRVVSNDEIVAVEICNMQGREIYNNKVKGKSAEIDVRGFDKGIYFVTIHTTKGTKTEKVIVE